MICDGEQTIATWKCPIQLLCATILLSHSSLSPPFLSPSLSPSLLLSEALTSRSREREWSSDLMVTRKDFSLSFTILAYIAGAKDIVSRSLLSAHQVCQNTRV